ncbi:hypothetical protein ANN_20784 [Periplaneta americana]|uniref:Uncharacterized protein n=1 Tax=Periplaneta americana TaxID=6978 RepID=A0ABQ8SDV4_PERAM|nr:hypothetical protein ANN_20784 [Periplaneta americana]
MGESRNAYRVLVGRPEGKRPLGRPRRRWEDNIKMDLREVGYDDRDWIGLAQDRDLWRVYVRAAMNLRFRIWNERWTQKVTLWDPRIGKRSPGRPRRRWADLFSERVGSYWSSRARHREDWRNIRRQVNSD